LEFSTLRLENRHAGDRRGLVLGEYPAIPYAFFKVSPLYTFAAGKSKNYSDTYIVGLMKLK